MICNASFVTFWKGIVVSDKSLPTPLRLLVVVIVKTSPSPCDAEGAMSVLDHIVSALRNHMSWGNIVMHLIEVEDLNAQC